MNELTRINLEKIETMLRDIEEAKNAISAYFSDELLIAADVVDTIKTLNDLENQMKQLRGKVIEYIV